MVKKNSNDNLPQAVTTKAGGRGLRTPLGRETQIKTLLCVGYTPTRISRDLDIPVSTIKEIRKRITPEEMHEWSQRYRVAAGDLIEVGMDKLVEMMENNKLRGFEVINAVGVAVDKTLVLEGRPTAIDAHLHAHRHEIHDLGRKLAVALSLIDKAEGIASDTVNEQGPGK